MKKLFSVFVLFIVVLSSCKQATKKEEVVIPEDKLEVFTVNYPLYYFAERIGGDFIELIYPIPADVDPAYWVPEDLEEIQAADLILANGANYAKWMEKVSLPSSKVLNTSKGFTESYIEVAQGPSHSHGNSGEHVHYGYAFTTWLDFKIAMGQAETIKNALVEKLPAHKDEISANYEALKSELADLDKALEDLGKELEGQTLFVSHPVYQYLGDAYGLELISEHWEPGVMPDAEQWDAFKHNLDHHPANYMLWEGKPSDEIKGALNDLGITTIVFNPSANKAEGTNFIEIMEANINNTEEAVSVDIN